MVIKDFLVLVNEMHEKYGDDLEIAIDATPPAEANEITGVSRIYESDGGVMILALKLGWRIA